MRINRRAFLAALLAPFMPKAPKAAPLHPVYSLLDGRRLHTGAEVLYAGGYGGGKSVAAMHQVLAAIRRGDSVYIPGRRSIK